MLNPLRGSSLIGYCYIRFAPEVINIQVLRTYLQVEVVPKVENLIAENTKGKPKRIAKCKITK